MNTIKNAGNFLSDKVQGTGAEASKEANKAVAKDSQAPLSTRARAAGDMISDKMDQHGHERYLVEAPTKDILSKFSFTMIGLPRTLFRVLSKPYPSLAYRTHSFATTTPFAKFIKAPHTSAFKLQRRFASDEAQTQSEPLADDAQQTQDGDNSIAAAAPERNAPNETSEFAEPASQRNDTSSTQGSSGYSTIGDFASAAADKAKDTASSAYDAITGGAGRSSDPARVDFPESKSVYIGNLFFDVREDDLSAEFGKCGTIENVKIIMDNRGLSKGFGYINFTDVAGATAAVEQYNLQPFSGRRLTVQYAAQRGALSTRPRNGASNPSRTLFIGNMAFDMSDRELNNLFREVRNVVDVRVAIDRRTGQPRGFAHADFTDVESAKEAMVTLAGKEVAGRPLRVDYSASTGRAAGLRTPEGEGRPRAEDAQQGY
ncbi:MAG: hypothetical protein Q9220_001753 [cf. Caloplaca sp. 1 TL-2023]